MSLLSSVLLPMIEKELVSLEPSIEQFVISQLQTLSQEVLAWAENKLHIKNDDATQ